jgi:hypothetical protein
MAMQAEIKGAVYAPQSPDEHIRGISLLLPVEERGGFVFIIAYTKKETPDSEILLTTLADHVRRLGNSCGKESNLQHRFEQFLGALNETLATSVREGRWSVPIEHLHAVLGIASSSEMFISGTGELFALFLHQKTPHRYQLFNLFRSLQTEQSLPTWEKAFTVVLDGELHPGDVFCGTDKDLQQTIPPDELNSILSSLPPKSAVEKIRQYYPHKQNILLTVIKMMGPELANTHITRPVVNESNQSVDALQSTREVTKRLLAVQGPSFRAFFKLVTSFFSRSFKGKTFPSSARLTRQTVWILVKKTGRILLHHFRTSLNFRRLSTRQEKNPIQRKKETIDLKRSSWNFTQVNAFMKKLFQRVRKPQPKTKYLVGGVVLACLILGIGITVLSRAQAQSREEAAYQELVRSIDILIEQGAGAIIYQDENQARTAYQQAQSLLETLTEDTPERKANKDDLSQKIQVGLQEIQHLVTIPNPPLLANLESVSDGVLGTAISKDGGSIFVTGSNGRLYQYNQSQKTFDPLSESVADTPTPIDMSQEDGRTYILNENGSITFHSTVTATSTLLVPTDDRWVDLNAYANRLYLLRPSVDETPGQIIRYTNVGSGLDQETSWITSRTSSMDSAVSLAIDGSAYILMSNGSIVRFTQGSEDGWNVSPIDPPITHATRLWTSPESAYLYVIEPATRRLIVILKSTGEFVVQYRSDAFEQLTDFTVDEAGYTIYLLAGTKLFSIAPSHLQ